MEFPQLTSLVIYHILFWSFCTLANITISYFLPDRISDAGPLQMLVNCRLCSIYSWTKDIHMVPMYYVTLDFWRNSNIILTCYKFKTNITTSAERTLLGRTIFIFSFYARFQPLIFLINFKLIGKVPSGIYLMSLISNTISCW